MTLTPSYLVTANAVKLIPVTRCTNQDFAFKQVMTWQLIAVLVPACPLHLQWIGASEPLEKLLCKSDLKKVGDGDFIVFSTVLSRNVPRKRKWKKSTKQIKGTESPVLYNLLFACLFDFIFFLLYDWLFLFVFSSWTKCRALYLRAAPHSLQLLWQRSLYMSGLASDTKRLF